LVAEHENEEEDGKKINITCSYVEENKNAKKQKARVAAKSRSLSRDLRASVSVERETEIRGRKPRKASRSPKTDKGSSKSHDSCKSKSKSCAHSDLSKSPSPIKKRNNCTPPKKDNKKEDYRPKLEGEFYFHGLEKDTKYVISVHEYNDISNKCQNIGGFYNPQHLKKAPGVKYFTTDKNGDFEKSFKNLDLAISTRDSIINRSCLLKKIIEEPKKHDRKRGKKDCKEFSKCATITWEPPYWANAVNGYE